MFAHRRGFTLAEMLIACAVLAIAAAVVLPSAQPVTEARANAAAAEVTQALRFARDEAQRTATLTMVRCDTAQNTVSVYVPDSSGNVNTAINDPLTHMNYAVSLSQAPAGARASLIACSFVFSALPNAATLAFDASGNPVRGTGASTGPGATATQSLSAGTIQLTVGKSTRTVAIDANGRVTTS
jgi:prepilin-type N-terminal cleavage/methylation domain-containing protein